MDTPMQQQWAKKSRFLTQALIFSGALNIGLLTSFFYFVLRDPHASMPFDLQPVSVKNEQLTNRDILAQFSAMSYAELIDLLGDDERVEEGYRKKDLALACLATFHCINIEKALQGFPLQKRTLSFERKEGPERVDITLYPALGEDQFQAAVHFIKTERYPFTHQGLFFELKQAQMPPDPFLLEAFYLTPEFTAVMTLLTRCGVLLPQEYVINLILQGEWKILQQFVEHQKLAQDLSPLRLKTLLLDYVRCRSALAAKILLQWDREYISKKLDDNDLMVFLDLFPQKTESLELLLKELITSPRSDLVWKKAAEKLYTFAQLPYPDPYDHMTTLKIFAGEYFAVPGAAASPPLSTDKKHVVQVGENLWKIARRYKVSMERLKKANRLETDKLRPGKELIIPKESKEPLNKCFIED